MKKPVFAVDFDDVLTDLMLRMCEYHNKTHGTNHTVEDYFTYDLEEVFGCTKEESERRLSAFYLSPEMQTVLPQEDALHAITILKEVYALELVTARPEHMRLQTEEYLHRCFPQAFGTAHFTSYYVPDNTTRLTKGEICDRIGAVAFVDDALHHVASAVRPDRTVFLLDRPWNRKETPPGIIRAKNWHAIVEHLVPPRP